MIDETGIGIPIWLVWSISASRHVALEAVALTVSYALHARTTLLSNGPGTIEVVIEESKAYRRLGSYAAEATWYLYRSYQVGHDAQLHEKRFVPKDDVAPGSNARARHAALSWNAFSKGLTKARDDAVKLEGL